MGKSKLTTEEQNSSLWALGGLTVPQLVRRVWERMNRDDVLGRAEQLAYSFLLSIFPLLLFLISVFGVLASRGTALRTQLFNALGQALPPAAFRLTSRTVNEIIASSGGGKTLFGALLFLWSATAATTTMMSVLNAAYRVYDSRPWYKVRTLALGLTLCLCVLVVVALTVVLFGGQFAELLSTRVGAGSVVLASWKVLQWILALFALSLSFSLVYYFGPDVKEQHWYLDHARVRGRSAALGSLFSWFTRLSAFLQQLQQDLWIAGGCDNPTALVLRNRPGVPPWWRNQRFHRERGCRKRSSRG